MIEGDALRKMPGTNGDALRVVETMPGVARPAGGAGLLIVRGSAPRDTNVYVDGTWIPVVYHFGGITSVLPSDVLERIDFYPGNFSAEFGRGLGGIVDVALRSPRKDRHNIVQVDMLDGRLLAEGPLSTSTRVLVAARRSWVDAWIGPALRAAGNDIRLAPRFYDFQAMVEHDLSERTTVRATLFGSDDRMTLVVDGPAAADPALSGLFSTRYTFYRAQLRTDTRVADGVRLINMVSYGTDVQKVTIAGNGVDMLLGIGNARSDLRARIADGVTFIGGLDVLLARYDVTVKFPPVPTEDTPGPFFGRPARTVHGEGTSVRPGLYAMFELSPFKRLKVLPGVRFDWTPDTARLDVAPRIAARLRVATGTTLKGALGLYHQPPLEESVQPWGDGTLKSNRAVHASLGAEHAIGPFEISVEGFYKRFMDLIVPRVAAETPTGIGHSNAGTGRAYGAELLLKWKPGGRFFGWLAYTLSRSERDGHLFAFDQTHILAAVGSYDLGRGWTIGARFRYVTGTPYTPFSQGFVDLDAGAYEPRVGAPYSARVPAFHQLDVRIEKKWGWLTTYLDVQNAYNRVNAEGVQYNYDYSKRQVVGGLPLLPIVGLRGEL